MKNQQQASNSKGNKEQSTGKSEDKGSTSTRNGQSRQQQAQQGGAVQGTGKGKADSRK